MITMNLTLDKRRAKMDGTFPLIFRIVCNGVARDLATGFSALETDWNRRTNSIKESHPLFEVLNHELKSQKLTYLSKILEYEKAYPMDMDTQKIKDYLLAKSQKAVTVYAFWQGEIETLYKSKREGGAQVYKDTLATLSKVKNFEIAFEKVDYNFLKDLEVTLLNRGTGINTISVYLRTLRAIYNKAINAKVVSFDHYPFRVYRIKKEATRPRPITLEEMKAYFNLNLDKKSSIYDSWLLGKLIFMLIGINFIDLIMLSEVNFKGNRVHYRRAKTKTLYTINLLPEAIEIIQYFKEKNTFTLFGKLSKLDLNNPQKLPVIIRQRTKVFNSHLNKIGKMIDCNEKLTSYVFRYTWANIAKQLGYSKDLIAEALGHEYGSKITGIYLENYDKELVDEMNQKIYEAIKTKM